MADHQPDCRWERTTALECGYRDTHHYCPHPEHACTCPPKPTVADDLALALRLLEPYIPLTPCWQHRDDSGECSIEQAQALLVRHGLRQAQP